MSLNSIVTDGIQHSQSLFGLAGALELYLDAIEIRRSSDGSETWTFHDDLIPLRRNLTIHVRTDDKCHATPHFHVNRKGDDTSFTYADYERLAGAAIGPDTAQKIRSFFLDLGGSQKLSSLAHPDDAGSLQDPACDRGYNTI